MARIARVVAEHYPHYITQRGNRRQDTFFCEGDYLDYILLMAEWCDTFGVKIWAYCLMPNHVHLIAVPESVDGLRRAIGEAHRRYTRQINCREKWEGHLWQGRFSSFLMDERYLLAATRYVEHNPVKAGLISRPEDYRWSSARAHMNGKDDILVTVKPLLALVGNWREFLDCDVSNEEYELFQRHERTGRPLGSKQFIERLENQLDRILTPQKGGRPKKV
jgi:putative transposase